MKGSLIISLIATPFVVAFVPSTQGRWSRQRFFAATDGDGDEMSWQEGLERVLPGLWPQPSWRLGLGPSTR